jgi:acyl carrier protein
MSEQEVRDVVFRSLREVAPEVDAAALDPAAGLREQVDLDSMDFLNFVIGLHEKTGVEIPETDYPALATLDGCVAYLATRAPAAKA